MLVAGPVLGPSPTAEGLAETAGRIVIHNDFRAPRRTTHGSAMSVMYGAAGARGEAPAGFPHVRRALKELAAPRRVGVTEVQARLGALLTVTSTLRDSERPHVTEPLGLRHIHVGACTVPLATGTPRWRGAEPLFARARRRTTIHFATSPSRPMTSLPRCGCSR
ncbi:triphosphoribosyl-dephospho-CoA synthase [Streptomyces sp. enrichment culture]|uniref:triphosphoribosyl-dephospho-CoA synthase n=1 Tax=Streptomyces sp. enrichment culture TaxID=1795815 RepID=UPI003F563B1F